MALSLRDGLGVTGQSLPAGTLVQSLERVAPVVTGTAVSVPLSGLKRFFFSFQGACSDVFISEHTSASQIVDMLLIFPISACQFSGANAPKMGPLVFLSQFLRIFHCG